MYWSGINVPRNFQSTCLKETDRVVRFSFDNIKCFDKTI